MRTACTSPSGFPNPLLVIGFALYAAGLALGFAPVSSSAAGNDAAAELSQSALAQASGKWRATGHLITARYFHTATLLPNGKVLVAGGSNNIATLASAELYDPSTGVWTATDSMSTARVRHTATLLPNGKVLVVGGNSGPGSPELYHPATGSWTTTENLQPWRWEHMATLLPSGKVLVSGGAARPFSRPRILALAQLYKSAP
jgi:WD40 repeat protein